MALTDNLISYYKLDEASGSVLDAHGSNNGTNTGATPGATGKIGSAYDFDDNSADRVDCNFVPSGSNYSWQAWVYPTASTASRAWRILDSTANNQGSYIIYNTYNGGIIQFNKGTGATLQYARSTYKLSDHVNEWTHIICVWDGTDPPNIYVNGSDDPLSAETFTTDAVSWGAQELIIGNRSGYDRGFEGVIDEVGIWARALTSGEVVQLYNDGAGLAYPFSEDTPVLQNYKLNDGFVDINYSV